MRRFKWQAARRPVTIAFVSLVELPGVRCAAWAFPQTFRSDWRARAHVLRARARRVSRDVCVSASSSGTVLPSGAATSQPRRRRTSS